MEVEFRLWSRAPRSDTTSTLDVAITATLDALDDMHVRVDEPAIVVRTVSGRPDLE